MRSRLSLEDIQHLSDEIRHLVRAGMPLEESLAQAGRGRGVQLENLTKEIADGLSQGRSLQDVVDQQSIGVPRMLASAIGAGVQSGDLGLTVEMMGDFAADVVELRNKLLRAAAYPLTIVALAGMLLVLIVQHALEIFYETILSWKLAVHPWLMKLLEWNREMPGWTLLIPVAGLVLMVLWMMSGRASAMAFKGPERLFLLLPGVGALVRDLQYYTLSRMLSLLTERGLPLQEALTLAGGASGSNRLERGCREMAQRVQRGQSVNDDSAVKGSATFGLPSLLRVCLKQVEHSEDRMFHRLRSVADFYRNRLERNSAWVRLVMPVALFIVVGGGCVLVYATMVFWPVSELYRHLGS